MFGIAQAPAKQTATEAIAVLSGRLQSATLLEDRRNAVLGLRSFSRQYPASVASGALRGLIGSLSQDIQDVDTVKVVLETLLMLFNPDEKSPEASAEVVLWLADEFTQRQENITILLDLLDSNEFYPRLYSLQLLAAILSSRTERTEECIFTAPLGISRLVATLDDRREAIRNEGLSLLTYLTPNSFELQKLVAFENAFDRIFNIIEVEGSLSQGGRVVEDCLILLANLLRLNTSNQAFFRETGCVPKLARILSNALSETGHDDEVAEWAQEQRTRNVYAFLAVLRLLLIEGSAGSHANQASFWQHGILNQVLQLAFSDSSGMQIRAEALITCADIIRGNPMIQEAFAQYQVQSSLVLPSPETNGAGQHLGASKLFVIDALLDLTLSVSANSAFDARMAACECIKAYFYNHAAVRLHFLRRAITGHTSGADETANVLTSLVRPSVFSTGGDPYRRWFAAVILFHLIYDDAEAKSMARSITEGDASNGEEVVTCIQNVAANLISAIHQDDDDRIAVGYLILLCGWLFEDPESVDDFLGEASNVQSLVQAVVQGARGNALIQGLSAMLLGIVYEFSTKDSPLPRSTLHSILAARMGRDQYIDRLSKLRKDSVIRDFEILPQKLGSSAHPEVYFDKTFVDFFKDNYSRLVRAIDRDPGFEIPVMSNGVQKGISRELVDTLRAQLEEKDRNLHATRAEVASLENQLGQERAESRRARETAILDAARIKTVNEALQRSHEDEMRQLQNDQQHLIREMQLQAENTRRTAEKEAAHSRNHYEAQITDLNQRIADLEGRLAKAEKDHLQDLKTAHTEHSAELGILRARLEQAEDELKTAELRINVAATRLTEAERRAGEKEEERAAAQIELDDLLMVFGDLEEKLEKYKKRLLALGEVVSDGEDNGGGDEEEEDEENGDELNGDKDGEGEVEKGSEEEEQVEPTETADVIKAA